MAKWCAAFLLVKASLASYIAVWLSNYWIQKHKCQEGADCRYGICTVSSDSFRKHKDADLSVCNYFHALSSFPMRWSDIALWNCLCCPWPCKITQHKHCDAHSQGFQHKAGNTHGVLPVNLRSLTLLPLKTKAKPLSLHWDHDSAQQQDLNIICTVTEIATSALP